MICFGLPLSHQFFYLSLFCRLRSWYVMPDAKRRKVAFAGTCGGGGGAQAKAFVVLAHYVHLSASARVVLLSVQYVRLRALGCRVGGVYVCVCVYVLCNSGHLLLFTKDKAAIASLQKGQMC